MIFFKQHWLKIGIFLLLILPAISFTLASLSILAFVYWPSSFDKIDFDRFDTQHSHLLVLTHGVKDNAESWNKPLKNTLQQQGFEGDILAVDWSEYAQSSLTCAIEGKRIGRLLGKRILQNKNLRSVHMIGHSCGAFVIHGACETIKHDNNRNENNNAHTIEIQTTYLDPVSVYGILWQYGINHFGRCADYSEAYIDTEDSVPGSNQLLPYTHTYDITAVRHKREVEMNPHLWPIAYYRQLVKDRLAPELNNDNTLPNRKPVGELEMVYE